MNGEEEEEKKRGREKVRQELKGLEVRAKPKDVNAIRSITMQYGG